MRNVQKRIIVLRGVGLHWGIFDLSIISTALLLNITFFTVCQPVALDDKSLGYIDWGPQM